MATITGLAKRFGARLLIGAGTLPPETMVLPVGGKAQA
jgi:hypothetical protein